MSSKSNQTAPDVDLLKGFLKTGKTIDWISEKWNVTPQTVRAWFTKFNLSLPKRESVKNGYTRKRSKKVKACPICQQEQYVNYLAAEKHWYCMNCETEFDINDVIYVYNDKGELVEVIASKPDHWETVKPRAGKKLIRTITV